MNQDQASSAARNAAKSTDRPALSQEQLASLQHQLSQQHRPASTSSSQQQHTNSMLQAYLQHRDDWLSYWMSVATTSEKQPREHDTEKEEPEAECDLGEYEAQETHRREWMDLCDERTEFKDWKHLS